MSGGPLVGTVEVGERTEVRVRDSGAGVQTDAEAGFRWRFVQAQLQVNNVLGTEWKEVQFANESQLADETEPVQDIHFTPGWPRTILGTVTVYR